VWGTVFILAMWLMDLAGLSRSALQLQIGGVKDWRSIWLAFAAYAVALGVLFPFVFKYRHRP
jgi:hypothetical protein